MKKKLLLSSIATMAIFGSLVVGGTYALFTSESTTSITVTSATVKVDASISDLVLYSNDVQQEGTFENGGTATLDKGKLNISNITPGDKISCKISLENKSNVNILYRIGYLCEAPKDSTLEDSKLLFNGLDMDFNGVKKNGFISYKSKYVRLPANGIIEALPVTIELPKDAGNEYQEKATSIKFIVEAVQGNATVDDKEEIEYYVPETAQEVSTYSDIKTALEAGENEISLTGDIVAGAPEQVIEIVEAKKDLSIYGNGHTIKTDKDRVINVNSVSEGLTINLTDISLSTQKTKSGDRSISVYNSSDVTINLSNCNLEASHYPLNIAGLADGTVINADRTSFSGYCAMQTHSKLIGTFTNCDLYGVNKFEYDGWNNYSTLVFNYKLDNTNGSGGSDVTFENCNIYALSLANAEGNANRESFLSVRENDVKVTLTNNNFYTAFAVASLENPEYKKLEAKEEIVGLLDWYSEVTTSSILLNGEELIQKA